MVLCVGLFPPPFILQKDSVNHNLIVISASKVIWQKAAWLLSQSIMGYPTLIETLLFFPLVIALFDMKNDPNHYNRWTSTSQCLSTKVQISLIPQSHMGQGAKDSGLHLCLNLPLSPWRTFNVSILLWFLLYVLSSRRSFLVVYSLFQKWLFCRQLWFWCAHERR